MKHLLAVWENLKPVLKDRELYIFLDYDGTLTPIVAKPSLAVLKPEDRQILKDLAAQKGVNVAVISGRALSDIKQKVGISGITYAGNHGLEVEGPKIQHVHPSALEFQRFAGKLAARLKKAYKEIPEILVEGKTFTLSVHYRGASDIKVALARMILLKEIGTYLSKSQVSLTEGKKVWEIRPPTEWNKGKTVLWLTARMSAHTGRKVFPIYAGDDLTDEDAFRSLKRRGITVKVSDDEASATEADYYVWKPNDILDFLKRIVMLRQSFSREKI